MDNKGFAISAILYSILTLFLMLLLLILGNFQSRKVIFDKQKNNVLEKLQQFDNNNAYCYTDGLYKTYNALYDGNYELKIYNSNTTGSISAKVNLTKGSKLYILVGQNGGISNIRIDKDNDDTVILDSSGFAYTSGSIEGSSIGYLTDVKQNDEELNNNCPDVSNSGFVNIVYIGN